MLLVRSQRCRNKADDSIPVLLFEIDQIALHLQAAGVAAKRSIFANHPVAGHDDSDWVSSRSSSGGADGPRRANSLGKFGVGDGLTEWNARDFLPDALLERSSFGVKRKGKILSLSFEEILKFRSGLLQDRMAGIELPFFFYDGNMGAAGEVNADEVGGAGDEDEIVDGGFEDGIGVHDFFSRLAHK